MAEIEFAKIPFDLICRFGELTKNEIQVVACLYAHRNQETGQCNPSRKTLMSETGLVKSNLSRAISNLEEKCWIVEKAGGDFILFESYQIDNCLEKKLSNQQPEVINLITESNQFDNQHKKELNREGTEKGTNTHTAPARPFDPLVLFRKYFPLANINDYQEGQIRLRIRDGTIWEKALLFWAGNGHIGKNIFNLCNKYDEILKERNGGQNKNGSNGNDIGTRQGSDEKRANDATNRIVFDRAAEQLLESEGVVQVKRG